jgi:hypothetical protein
MADNRSANGFIRAEDVLNSVGPRDGRASAGKFLFERSTSRRPAPQPKSGRRLTPTSYESNEAFQARLAKG